MNRGELMALGAGMGCFTRELENKCLYTVKPGLRRWICEATIEWKKLMPAVSATALLSTLTTATIS